MNVKRTMTDDVIEELVIITHGCSDRSTQDQYRTNLRVLVELAKEELRREMLGIDYQSHRASLH